MSKTKCSQLMQMRCRSDLLVDNLIRNIIHYTWRPWMQVNCILTCDLISWPATRDSTLTLESRDSTQEYATCTQDWYSKVLFSDPKTKKFMTDNIDAVFGYPQFVRFSWSTATTLLEDKAVRVRWSVITLPEFIKDVLNVWLIWLGHFLLE